MPDFLSTIELAADTTNNPMTFTQLVQLMVDSFTASREAVGKVTDFSEGSITLALFEGVAAPLEELNYQMAVVLPAKFYLDEAGGEALDRLVSNFTFGQVVRVPAATAAGNVVFHGADGTTIGDGTVFASPSGLLFKSIGNVSIPVNGSFVAVGAVVALAKGGAYNLPPDSTLVATGPVTGLTNAVVGPLSLAGGADAQSDAELRDAVVAFLDSLSKGTVAAIAFGCKAAGYDRVYVQQPGSGRVIATVDDGSPLNLTKLEACRASVEVDYKAAGARLTVRTPPTREDAIQARAFTNGTQTLAFVQAGILAAWTALYATKRMGDAVTRLELLAAAATVAGYNGVSLYEPALDLGVKQALDEYNADFGEGHFFPYERPVLGLVSWV